MFKFINMKSRRYTVCESVKQKMSWAKAESKAVINATTHWHTWYRILYFDCCFSLSLSHPLAVTAATVMHVWFHPPSVRTLHPAHAWALPTVPHTDLTECVSAAQTQTALISNIVPALPLLIGLHKNWKRFSTAGGFQGCEIFHIVWKVNTIHLVTFT